MQYEPKERFLYEHPAFPKKVLSLEGKVVAFTGEMQKDHAAAQAEALGATVVDDVTAGSRTPDATSAGATVRAAGTAAGAVTPARDYPSSPETQVIVAGFGAAARLATDSVVARTIASGKGVVWSEEEFYKAVDAGRHGVLEKAAKRKGDGEASAKKKARQSRMTCVTAQADGYPSVPLKEGRNHDGSPRSDVPNGVAVRCGEDSGKWIKVWWPAGEGNVKRRNLRALEPPSGTAITRQKESWSQRKLGEDQQQAFERDMNTRALRSALGRRKAACMGLMPGPGPCSVCTKCLKDPKATGLRHLWLCHGCQTEQVSGACVNSCDASLVGWTCVQPRCVGKSCEFCKKSVDHWRINGRDWMGVMGRTADAVKAAAAQSALNRALAEPMVKTAGVFTPAAEPSAALQRAVERDRSASSQVIKDGVMAA